MSRHAENARLDAELRLRRKQRFHARLFTVSGHAADNVGGGFRFGFALRHTYNDGHGFSLVCNRIQRTGQRAGLARFTAGGQHIGQQNRLIEWKHGRISIIAGAYHAHNGGAHRGNGSGALVDFNNAHAVVVVLSHKAVSPVYRVSAYVLVDMRTAHAPGYVWRMAQWKGQKKSPQIVARRFFLHQNAINFALPEGAKKTHSAQCKNERKECLVMLLLSRITFVESRQADPIFESYITM